MLTKYNISIIIFIFLTYFIVYILLRKNRKNPIKHAFHNILLVIACVSLSEFGYFSASKEVIQLQLFWTLINSFWPFIMYFQLKFAVFYTKNNDNGLYKLLLKIFLFLCITIILYLIFLNIREYLVFHTVYFNTFNNNILANVITSFWISIVFIISIILCIKYLSKVRFKREKIQSYILITAILLSFITSFIFKDLLPKIFDIHLEELSTAGSFLSILLFTFAVLRYEFFIINPEMAAENIINIIPDALILIDSNLNIVKINRALTQLTGYEEEEIVNSKINKLFDKTNLDINIIIKHFEKNRIYVQEQFIVNSNNDKIPISLSATPLVDKNNEILGSVLILSNLSKIVDLIRDKENLQDQLFQSQKLESLGHLAGGIAHDFNNSIGAIHLLAEDARDKYGGLLPDLKDSLEDILTATNQVKDLTNQLLAFARKGKYEISTFQFHDVINEVIKILNRTFDKKIVIEKNLSAKNCFVKGDFRQLQNVLFNISLNARDAMPNGGKIKFETQDITSDEIEYNEQNKKQDKDNYLKVSVIDNGIGMDNSTVDKIFDPFFSTKLTGTGLGLSSVYGIIKNHSGNIKVESMLKKGTSFSFYLPIVKEIPHEVLSEEKPTINGNGMILVVDDQESVRTACLRVLKSLGYTAAACVDGEDALSYYKNNYKRIDLVLLDLIMPKINGIKCFEELKKINRDVKVIIMTGFTNDGDMTKLLDQGVIDFIEKPFTKRSISKKISQILN